LWFTDSPASAVTGTIAAHTAVPRAAVRAEDITESLRLSASLGF
jgi:hypothetical protein